MPAPDHLSTAQFFSKPMGKNPASAYNAVNQYNPSTVRQVKISTITPTQPTVYAPGVAQVTSDEHDPVRLYQGSKRRTVWDGHHRIAAAVQRGDTHINAAIFTNPYK